MEKKIKNDRRVVRSAPRGTVNNKVMLAGRLLEDFVFFRRGRETDYYTSHLCVYRNTGSEYTIPILVPESLIPSKRNAKGLSVEIQGEFRSYNYSEGLKNRTFMLVFVHQLESLERYENLPGMDQIYLDGFVCKTPYFRRVSGMKEVTTVILAVNRIYKRTDYIPCIFWNDAARTAAGFSVGTHLSVWGEICSRTHREQSSLNPSKTRTVCEVTVGRMEEK